MSKDLILAIDNGTQSVRGLIYDAQGTLIAKSRIPITSYVSEAPGLVELDPEIFWDSVCQACQQLWVMPGNLKERIAGVTVTTQRSTVINLDKDGKPLRPAMVWLDQRRTQGLKPVSGLWGLAFLITGMKGTVAYLQAEAEANWIRIHQPEIWDKTHKYVFLSGYLTYMLTGNYKDSVGCQVGYLPFDYKSLHWSNKFDWKWQAVPVEPSKLVELISPGSFLGEITPQASKLTGIPASLPLIAAAADKACEVIGTGCINPEQGCLSFGTSATINTTHYKYVEAIPLIPPYPSAIPNAYSLEVQIYRGFWMVSWFKQEFGQYEIQLAEELGVDTEVLFDKLVQNAPPGSNGLMLQPYWAPGLKFPGPEARGAIIGFADSHTRAHLYRGILEGLIFALREGAEQTEKRSKIKIKEIRIAGGGSQSDAAMQITADVFGLPASRPHVYEASGLGAAIDAAVGLGIHRDFKTAINAMTRTGAIFEPDEKNHLIYDDLYLNVYRKMYKRLHPLYKDIQRISPKAVF